MKTASAYCLSLSLSLSSLSELYPLDRLSRVTSGLDWEQNLFAQFIIKKNPSVLSNSARARCPEPEARYLYQPPRAS